MTSNLCPFKFNSLEERKSNKDLYYEIFKWKMSCAPKMVHRFCDTSLNENERHTLVRWLRYAVKIGTSAINKGVGRGTELLMRLNVN